MDGLGQEVGSDEIQKQVVTVYCLVVWAINAMSERFKSPIMYISGEQVSWLSSSMWLCREDRTFSKLFIGESGGG